MVQKHSLRFARLLMEDRGKFRGFWHFCERQSLKSENKGKDLHQIHRLCKMGIKYQAKRGRRVHFVLENLNQADVVQKNRRSVTGSELRSIYRQWSDPSIRAAVQFWSMDQEGDYVNVSAPWHNPQTAEVWSQYQPKSWHKQTIFP